MDLKGKVVLITGGARGIGKAYAEAVLKAGGKISLLDVLEQEGTETDKGFKEQFGSESSKFIKCDVSNTEELEKSFRETKEYFGRLDIVVNNAGICKSDDRNYDSLTVDINLKAEIKGTYLALDYLRKDQGGPGGIIVNIASIAGLDIYNLDGIAVYTASKHGVVAFTRCLAMSIGEPSTGHGVKLLCLCPGSVDTDMSRENREAIPDAAKKAHNIGYITVDTMAEAFMKLLSDANNHGGVMSVTPEGMKYQFPEHLKAQEPE